MPPDDMLEPYGESEGGTESAMPPMGDMASEPLDDFGAAITEAFPDNTWTPERLDAMKEAIRICMEKDEAGEYGSGGGSKGDVDLALVLGAPPKKKS